MAKGKHISGGAKGAKTYDSEREKGLDDFDSPEDVAAAIDEATDPFVNFRDAAKRVGMHPNSITALVRRLETRYLPVRDEIRKVKTETLLALIDDRLLLALEVMDQQTLLGATARDLAVVIGTLVDKRALLRGEPTVIYSAADRDKARELMPALVNEMVRRGMVPDAVLEAVKGVDYEEVEADASVQGQDS